MRDFVSRFDPSGLGAEESLGLLDDYLEVAKHFKPHGFSCDKAKAGSSEWLAVDRLVSFSDNSKEDAFSRTDWMVEKMDLKEFDFNDALLSMTWKPCQMSSWPLWMTHVISLIPYSRRLTRGPPDSEPNWPSSRKFTNN